MEEDSNPPIPPPGFQTTHTQSVQTSKPSKESQIFGLSVRGFLASIAVLTVCYMSIRQLMIEEPLYSLVLLMVGFYFGQNSRSQKTQ